MKRIFNLKHIFGVFVLFSLLLVQGCTESEESIDVTDPVRLELSSSTLEFDYNGNSIDGLNGKIEVSSNRWWEVEFDAESSFSSWDWSIDFREMEDDGSFTITVPKSYVERKLVATVKVYNQKGELTSQSVEITQYAIADPVDSKSSISDVVALLGQESSLLSEEYNLYFEAVVTAFSADGTMFIQAQDASAPGDGIAIAANAADALESTYAQGDIVTVTIPAMTGMGLVVNDAPQLTYSTIEIVKGSTATVTPVTITASELKSNDYVNMFVAISNATPQEDGGIWTDGESDGSHIFTVGSETFTVFVSKDEEDLFKVPFSQETGIATGIAGSSVVSGQLIVSKQSQVLDFAFTDPVITSITPTSRTFYAEGGSQEFVLGGTNLADKVYDITGLGSEFTYIIDASSDKPIITVSTAESFIDSDVAEQTATITTEDQSISFTVSQKAAIIATGLASNATSSSIDVSGSIEFVNDYSSVEVGVEYSSNSSFSDGVKVAATSPSSSWLTTISGLAESTTYYFRAYAVAGGKTITGDSITGTTSAAGSEVSFMTIPELRAAIVATAEAKATAASNNIEPYQGEGFKVRGIVTSDYDSGNAELGYVFIATEGATEAGHGVGIYVGWYDSHVTSIANLALGDEVIVTMASGIGMYNYYGAPYISTWNNANITFEETGRNVAVEPIVIDKDDFTDYYGQVVTIEDVTISTADSFSSTNKNYWITDAGIAVRIASNSRSIFKGVSYNAATGSVTGIAHSQAGTTCIFPRNLADFSDFLDASYFAD